jgi:hypothetical protein
VFGGHAGESALARALTALFVALISVALAVGLAPSASADDATHAITGVVTTPAGKPAKGVSVRLDNWSGFLRSATTAADGSYRFDGLADGSYSLQAVAPEGSGYQTAWNGAGPSAGGRAAPTFDVSADLDVPLQFQRGGTLTGIVRLDGQPRAGVKVCPDYPADPARCVHSGADGRYTITDLPTYIEAADPAETGSGVMYPPTAFPNPGDPFVTTLDWSSSYHGRYLPTFGIPDDTRVYAQDIDLAPITYVTGTVLSTSGAAVQRAAVCYSGVEVQRCTRSDAAGAFRVRVDFVTWDDVATLNAQREGYQPSAAVVVTQAHVSDPAVVTLTPLRKVRSQRPVVFGYRYLGRTLRAVKGSWTKGTHFTYRWYRNGKSIRHATRSSYRLTAADVSKRISVKVTGRKDGYISVARRSKPTVRVGVLLVARP